MIDDLESICLSLMDEPEAVRSAVSRSLSLDNPSRELEIYQNSGKVSLNKILAQRKDFNAHGISFTHYFNESYPEKLRLMPSPPIGFFLKGKLNTKPKIGVVGARAASPIACQLARRWARELAARGACIVSGLALGVDGSAHIGALESKQSSSTIAVLAHGLDQIYPSSHSRLASDIINSEGAIISEYSIGVSPLKHHFLDRNRIIAGLSDIVILVQAAERSGALATVRHALEMNREVGVIPWDPEEKRGAGGLKLLKDGAHLITSADDIFELVPDLFIDTNDTPIKNPIVDFLKDNGPTSITDLKNALGELIVNETTIIELELDNIIVRSGADLLTLNAG